jgi:hypothetical protein
MRKKVKLFLVIAIGTLILISGFLTWFIIVLFEGEKPYISIAPLPEFLSGPEKFNLVAGDMKSGLRSLKVAIKQKGLEVVVFEKNFPREGLFFRKGLRNFKSDLSINPKELKLAEGAADLQVQLPHTSESISDREIGYYR